MEKFKVTEAMLNEYGYYFSHVNSYSGEYVYKSRWDSSSIWNYGSIFGGSRADHHKSPRQQDILTKEDWDRFILDLTGPVEEEAFDTTDYVSTSLGWVHKDEWERIHKYRKHDFK